MALALLVTACGPEQLSEVPPELVGTWSTNDPAYVGRFLRITPDQVALGVGDGIVERYALGEVFHETTSEGELYTVEYLDAAGDTLSVAFYFNPGNGTIRLKNQQHMIWRRDER